MAKKVKFKLADLSKDRSRQVIGRILRESLKIYIWRYLLAFFLMICAAGATGASVFLMKNIASVIFRSNSKIAPINTPIEISRSIDEKLSSFNSWLLEFFALSTQPDLLQLVYISLAVILVFLVKGMANYGSNVILAKIGNNIVATQQYRISCHILKQSLAFFVRFPSSDLLGRTSYAANSSRAAMNILITRVQDFLTAAVLLFVMFKLDWRLSCGALFIMTPIGFLLAGIIRRINKVGNAQFLSSIKVVSTTQEAILGNKLIKTYTLEKLMQKRFSDTISKVEERSNKIAKITARTSPAMELMGGIAIATLIFYGGYRNIVFGEPADALIAFLTALLLAYEPVKRIAKMNVSLQTSLVGVNLLYQLLDSDYTIPDAPDAKPLKIEKGGIKLEHVTFGYRAEIPVVHDVTLNCPGGQVTALVGPSGSGKSTLFNLIERFYDGGQGSISIDGQDIRNITTQSLREHISLVSQDTFLFADTIRNNIRFARPGATDAEIEAAALAAYAHDFILEQPQGYETQIGENGGTLSGGQRQRISIARAFLKNAPILLLDEATSALDSESEQQIQQAFDRLMQGRTTIVIAHRFSTIRNARTIHVMQDGRLSASGSHQELLADPSGLYAHLYRLQYQHEDRN